MPLSPKETYQRSVIGAARVASAVLRRAGCHTQRILELLRPFRLALGSFGPAGLVITAQGLQFRVRNKDLMNLKVSLVGAHEFEVTRFVDRQAASSGGCFIDVGANIGYFSLLAARKLGPERVVAFEPSPSNLTQLRENLALNRAEGVRVIPKAAWSTSGTRLSLHVPDPYNFGANSLVGAGAVEAEVETTTLDDALNALDVDVIGILKVDVEGAECEVLHGMPRSFERRRPRYVICALDNPDTASRLETRSLLEGHGYRRVDFDAERPIADVGAPRATMLLIDSRQ